MADPELLPLDLSHIPGAEILWNNLYDSIDPAWTEEDTAWIRLPGGLFVDVSWYDQVDPHFCVRVVRARDWHNPLEKAECSMPRMVPPIVRRLAEKWADRTAESN